MVTLTARHGRDDDLKELLSKMKDAKGRWARHRSYRVVKTMVVGSVTATEVTGGGANGWHPHFHVIFVTSGEIDFSPLRDAWLASLRGAGLDGTGAGWDVRDADEIGIYIGKWGAAEELALKDHKKGRSGGRTPAQLLAASCDDDDVLAGKLWAEYACVFQGRRQLVWSRGLKALAGIGEVDDDQAAKDEKQDDQEETGRANIKHRTWVDDVAVRGADRRAEVLERAEEVGPDTAVAEISQIHDHGSVIEDRDVPDWDFVLGNLTKAALAAVRPPPGQGP
jgi:hypothetical protein